MEFSSVVPSVPYGVLTGFDIIAHFSQFDGIGTSSEITKVGGQCEPMKPFILAEATE